MCNIISATSLICTKYISFMEIGQYLHDCLLFRPILLNVFIAVLKTFLSVERLAECKNPRIFKTKG